MAAVNKATAATQQRLHPDDLEEVLVPFGLFGLIDPPRSEAIEALHHSHPTRIEVKMITVDHTATASTIARQLGLPCAGAVLSGQELSTLRNDELRTLVLEVGIYGQVSPEHRQRLVACFRSRA